MSEAAVSIVVLTCAPGDQALTTHVLQSSRGQPLDDTTVVPGVMLSDLDPDRVTALLRRLRATRGQVFSAVDDQSVLRMLGVAAAGDDGPGVTLAGLLALGLFPQQFFPQLDVAFVAFPTVSGEVRVALYPDRLEIASPGGLHGPVSREDLLAEPVSSSRNAHLAKLLEDVEVGTSGRAVCENRGSGLLATAAALRDAGIEPPELLDLVREFRVVIKNHGLLDEEALDWLSTIDTGGLHDRQRRQAATDARTRSPARNTRPFA